MAQNIPDLLTVSLQYITHKVSPSVPSVDYLAEELHLCTGFIVMCVDHSSCRCVDIPAMDYDGMVASLHLDVSHLLHHTSDGTEVGTLPIRTPVGHL